MRKRKVGERTTRRGAGTGAERASGDRKRDEESARPLNEKSTGKRGTPPTPTRERPRASSPRRAEPASGDAIPSESEGDRRLAAILGELRSLKEMVKSLPSAPTVAAVAATESGNGDAVLEGAVDSLRRLLSDLVEQRMESVVRDLAAIRQDAAALPRGSRGRIVEPLDRILDSLGAVRFEAEPMELVDPLIHAIAEERWHADLPEGVILETVRPGCRTARRLVVCRAAVAVNRRP